MTLVFSSYFLEIKIKELNICAYYEKSLLGVKHFLLLCGKNKGERSRSIRLGGENSKGLLLHICLWNKRICNLLLSDFLVPYVEHLYFQ